MVDGWILVLILQVSLKYGKVMKIIIIIVFNIKNNIKFKYLLIILGQGFRSLESFTISSTAKIRKIFTMKNPIKEYNR